MTPQFDSRFQNLRPPRCLDPPKIGAEVLNGVGRFDIHPDGSRDPTIVIPANGVPPSDANRFDIQRQTMASSSFVCLLQTATAKGGVA
jgi:hypothetical protein